MREVYFASILPDLFCCRSVTWSLFCCCRSVTWSLFYYCRSVTSSLCCCYRSVTLSFFCYCRSVTSSMTPYRLLYKEEGSLNTVFKATLFCCCRSVTWSLFCCCRSVTWSLFRCCRSVTWSLAPGLTTRMRLTYSLRRTRQVSIWKCSMGLTGYVLHFSRLLVRIVAQ